MAMTTRLMTRRNAIKSVGALTLAAASGTRLAAAPARTGKVAVAGGSVTYWIMGDGRGVPVLMVHGGPGGSHLHLTPLATLGKDRPVEKALATWNLDVEIAMIGPYWTRPGGAFGAYDGTPKLARIKVPSLLTYGQFDFTLGGQMCGYHQMINGSTLYQTKDGSHQPWFEFADDYNRRVADFLAPLG
jgi:pimeloyl-ACP methyl ester carboxylesterase